MADAGCQRQELHCIERSFLRQQLRAIAPKQNAPPFLEGRFVYKESDDDLLWLRHNLKVSLRRNKPLRGVLCSAKTLTILLS